MDNALDPDAMTAQARIAEVAEILATGILRYRLRSGAAARRARDRREHSVAESRETSVHGAKPL